MTGKFKGFEAKVLELNPEIGFYHCFIHREAYLSFSGLCSISYKNC
jgi:hypothetical protein